MYVKTTSKYFYFKHIKYELEWLAHILENFYSIGRVVPTVFLRSYMQVIKTI